MRSSGSVAIVVLATAVIGGASLPAAASSAKAPLTKAGAHAVATRINFHASDFPGYSVEPYQPTKAERAAGKRYESCVGTHPTFVDVTSSAFNKGDSYGYSSETKFVTSPAAVKQDARRAASAHARQCLEQEISAGATQVGASDVKTTVSPLTETPVAGLDALFGDQITVTFTVIGQSEALYGYDIGFGRGNAEISLDEIGTTKLAVSATHKPLTTLIARAKQQVPAGGLPLQHT